MRFYFRTFFLTIVCVMFVFLVLLIVVPDQPEYESSEVPGYRRQFRRVHKLAAPPEGRARTINPSSDPYFDEGMVKVRSNPPGRIIIRPRRPAPRKGFQKKKQAAQKQVRGQKRKKRLDDSNPLDNVQLKRAGRQRKRRSVVKRAASGSNKFPNNQEATRDRHYNNRRHRRSLLDTDPDVGKLPNQKTARSDTKAQHEHPASDVSTVPGSVPLLHAHTEPASQHSGRTSYLSDTSKLLTGNAASVVPLWLLEGLRVQHSRHRQQAKHKVAENSSSVAPSDGLMARHPIDEHKVSGRNKQIGAAVSVEVGKDLKTTQSSDKRLPAHTDITSQSNHAATAGRPVYGRVSSGLDMHNETGTDANNATKAKHNTRKEHSTHNHKTPVYEHLSSSSAQHTDTGDDLDHTPKDKHHYSDLDPHNTTEYGLDYDSSDEHSIHKRKTLVSSGLDPHNETGEDVYYATEDDKSNRDHQHSVTEDGTSNEHTIHKRMAPDLIGPLDPSLPLDIRMAVVRAISLGAPWSEQRALSGKVELSCRNVALKNIALRNTALKNIARKDKYLKNLALKHIYLKNIALESYKDIVAKRKTQWLHNGDPLKVQASRMLFQEDDLLVIKDLRATDTGVYECREDFGGKKALTVAFFALTVTSTMPTLLPRQTEPLTLDCHSQDMARALLSVDLTIRSNIAFYFGCRVPCDLTNKKPRTTRQWFHNDAKTSLLPADSLATEAKADTLTSSTRAMSGVWRCVVTHVESNRQWNTSWYRVFVKDPAATAAAAAQGASSALTKPWLVALVGAVVLAACIGVATLVAHKSGENLEERWGVMETRMMRKASRIGSVDTGISVSVSKKKLDNNDDDNLWESLLSQTDDTRTPSQSPSRLNNYDDDSLREPLWSQTDDTRTPSRSPSRLDNYDDDSLREPLWSQTDDTRTPSRSSSRSLTEEDLFFPEQ
ncbi:uncharacterized protein [Littorina saxatilis]